MGILRAFKKWRTKRRIHKLLLRVIKQFYLNTIKAGGIQPEHITKTMGFQRIANNGYDNGGVIFCSPFVFIFGSATMDIALVKDEERFRRYYDAQKIAEHWTHGYRHEIRQLDVLNFIVEKEDGVWWDDLFELAPELEDRWAELQVAERQRAEQLFHKLNTPIK